MKFLEESSQVKRTKLDIDEDDDYGYEPVLRVYNKPRTVNEVDAYLDGPILAPAYYRNLLHYMRMMEKEDELRIWMNSPGGNLETALDIIESMQKVEGDVQVIVTGRAYSAGSLIALSAPHLIIGDNANFMCHNANYGSYGKGGDVVKQVQFTEAQVKNVCKKAYQDFLTEDELQKMFMGQDFWFDSKETTERLEKRLAIQEKELAKAKKDAAKAKREQLKK
jgi:ATP-dependent protease ClpP protease subunit